MAQILQVEVLPIKNMILDNTWAPTKRQSQSQRSTYSTNIKNFKFLRLLHRKKPNQNPEDRQRAPLQTSRRELSMQRPSSSFMNYSPEKEAESKNQHLAKTHYSLKKYSSGETGHFNSALIIKTEYDRVASKNYFPQRKAKKNKNELWHKYCDSLHHSMATQQTESPVHSNTLARETEPKKMRKKTWAPLNGLQFSKTPSSRAAKQRGRHAVSQISPWNTYLLDRQSLGREEQNF